MTLPNPGDTFRVNLLLNFDGSEAYNLVAINEVKLETVKPYEETETLHHFGEAQHTVTMAPGEIERILREAADYVHSIPRGAAETANYVLDKVNRVEVIDDEGREFVQYYKDDGVRISVQDNGRTVKIFTGRKK